jgi:hypothetical protein
MVGTSPGMGTVRMAAPSPVEARPRFQGFGWVGAAVDRRWRGPRRARRRDGEVGGGQRPLFSLQSVWRKKEEEETEVYGACVFYRFKRYTGGPDFLGWACIKCTVADSLFLCTHNVDLLVRTAGARKLRGARPSCPGAKGVACLAVVYWPVGPAPETQGGAAWTLAPCLVGPASSISLSPYNERTGPVPASFSVGDIAPRSV